MKEKTTNNGRRTEKIINLSVASAETKFLAKLLVKFHQLPEYEQKTVETIIDALLYKAKSA